MAWSIWRLTTMIAERIIHFLVWPWSSSVFVRNAHFLLRKSKYRSFFVLNGQKLRFKTWNWNFSYGQFRKKYAQMNNRTGLLAFERIKSIAKATFWQTRIKIQFLNEINAFHKGIYLNSVRCIIPVNSGDRCSRSYISCILYSLYNGHH